jgi:hypothetical protein
MRYFVAVLLIAGFLFGQASIAAAKPSFDTSKIENLTGLKGKYNEEEKVFKITYPRTELKVSVEGWQMPPFMGLTSWAGFARGGKKEMMAMGDFVLFEDEINPIMSVALENGIEVTALHNHFIFDNPKIYFMHIEAEGSLDELAAKVRKLLDTTKEIRAKNSTVASNFGFKSLPEKSSITAMPLEETFKQKAQSQDGMVKFVFGRKAKLSCGCSVGKDLGVNTWAAFAGSDDNAAVDGDFAVLEKELQPVLKSLRKNQINIVAIHHHMTGETPRTLFLHYWGRGKSAELANSIKEALARGGAL